MLFNTSTDECAVLCCISFFLVDARYDKSGFRHLKYLNGHAFKWNSDEDSISMNNTRGSLSLSSDDTMIVNEKSVYISIERTRIRHVNDGPMCKGRRVHCITRVHIVIERATTTDWIRAFIYIYVRSMASLRCCHGCQRLPARP